MSLNVEYKKVFWKLRPTKDFPESLWKFNPPTSANFYRIRVVNIYPKEIRELLRYLFFTNQLEFFMSPMTYEVSSKTLFIDLWNKQKEKEYTQKTL